MSKVVISMVAMFILMIFPGAGLWGLLSNVLGGGVAESFFISHLRRPYPFSRAYRWMHRAYFGGDAVTER